MSVDQSKDINGKTILDEDLYIEKMGEIIERDYFPEITKYRKIISQQKLKQLSNTGITPREMTNETIDTNRKTTEQTIHESIRGILNPGAPLHDYPTASTLVDPGLDRATDDATPSSAKSRDPLGLGKRYTLTGFLDKFTSEDDASFAEIVVKNRVERVKKYPWLYLEDRKGEDLPQGQEVTYVHTWDYKNRNGLMNVPDTLALVGSGVPGAGAEINYGSVELCNTRYPETAGPEDGPAGVSLSRKTMAQLLTLKYNARQVGKIGADGKELLSASALAAKPILEGRVAQNSQQDSTNGFPSYKLIPSTPLIDSEGGETPLMTWGEVESTPLRQDHGSTPLCRTQGFHMPSITNKEKLALKLTAGVVKRNKEQKLKGAAHRRRILTPGMDSPFMTPDLTDRISCLSPAAHRLATRRLRISTNSTGILSSKKSDIFKRPRTKITPNRLTSARPESTRKDVKAQINAADRASGGSYQNLTDNLLKIPKI